MSDHLCPKCGRAVLEGAERCDACGAVQQGNQLARQDGAFARVHPAEVRQSAEEVLTGVLADMGGIEEVSTLERAGAVKIRDLEILLSVLMSDMARHGVLTPAGGTRKTLDRYLGVLDRWVRVVAVLGIKRRPKSVTDLATYLDSRYGAQMPTGTTDDEQAVPKPDVPATARVGGEDGQ